VTLWAILSLLRFAVDATHGIDVEHRPRATSGSEFPVVISPRSPKLSNAPRLVMSPAAEERYWQRSTRIDQLLSEICQPIG
jgi:hypothetical protein